MDEKQRMWVMVAAFVFLLVVSMAFIANKFYVYGARKACFNTNSQLIEGFKCSEPTQQVFIFATDDGNREKVLPNP